MKRLLFICLAFYRSVFLFAQGNTESNLLQISGYMETYYLYDFDQPSDHTRPGYFYSFNRHNELNLNLGFIKASYQKDKVRANLAFMVGTYPNANLRSETGVLRNVFEANTGVKMSKKHQLWLDAGIFASHIGFESTIGKDCWNLTRSLMAENSPYYESGVKISYTSDNLRWFVSGLVLNGWQHIERPPGNQTPALGHQITYKPNAKWILNSSSFISNEQPDSLRRMRYFHNFYGMVQISSKLAMTTGIDLGAEQKEKGSKIYNTWFTPVLILRWAVSKQCWLALRGEYYQDKHGVIIRTGTRNGFQTFGYSINFDYSIQSNVLWRVEARALCSKDAIFNRDGQTSKNNVCLASSLAISF